MGPIGCGKAPLLFQQPNLSACPLSELDLDGIAAILAKSKTLGIQLADAALVHLANREEIEPVSTLDRRDFGVLRLARGKRLRIIP